MLTIISMALGFISSLAPEFMKRWQDASDKKHELAMMDKQIAATERGYEYKADEVGVEAYRDMVVAAHQEQSDITQLASKWVINLSASVRPVITYLFMLEYIAITASILWIATHPELPWQAGLSTAQALELVWGEPEKALFAGILAYWFGDRAMAKRRAG